MVSLLLTRSRASRLAFSSGYTTSNQPGAAGSTRRLHRQLGTLKLFLPYKPALFFSLISFLFSKTLPPSSQSAMLPLTQPKAAKVVGAPPAYPPFLMANPPPLHMCPFPAISTYQVGPPGCNHWTTCVSTSSSFLQIFSLWARLSVPPGPVDTAQFGSVQLKSGLVQFSLIQIKFDSVGFRSVQICLDCFSSS